MKDNVKFVQLFIRIFGTLMLILGIIFWINQNGHLIIFHILIGVILALLILLLAIFSAIAGAPKGWVALTFVWAIILPIYGMTQATLLAGSFHWIVHVVHLLVGIIALGDTEVLVSQVNKIKSHQKSR